MLTYLFLGKTWGNPQGIPVLCLHGWLDNACSFDPLAPLLPNDSHRFIAIDLPGHGFSSHFPEGMAYRFSDTFTVIKYAKEYMNMEKFEIIGHSMGAAVAIWYSSIFPEDVDRLISIDLVNVGPVTLEKHAKKTKESVLSGVKTFKKLSKDKGQEEPTYEFIDAVARCAILLFFPIDCNPKQSFEKYPYLIITITNPLCNGV